MQEPSNDGYLSYSDVPSDPQENLLWRAWIWEKSLGDPEMQHLLRESCRLDPRFYIASFCYTIDTRKEEAVLPFIPWDFQEVIILLTTYNIIQSQKRSNRYRRWDIGVDKSRDMGVTWSILLTLDWFWRFDSYRHFRTISWKEDMVDGSDDDDALFQKLDFVEERLPSFLAVRGANHNAQNGRRNLNVANLIDNNTNRGEASGPNAGRGGRNAAAFRDEEAFATNGSKITKSLNQTTRCQIRVSTPNGISNSFASAKQKGGIDWISLHWSLHPEKSEGLYESKRGDITVIDRKWHDENPGYNFRKESSYADPGTAWEYLRSPWFDGEVDAADTIYDVMQEIQISYLGTGSPWFRADKLQVVKEKFERPPLHAGDISDFLPPPPNGFNFEDRDQRYDKAKLWFNPTPHGKVPQLTTYTMGVDVSSGNGGRSDSSISIADDKTGEVVFEYRSNGITPENFARLTLEVYDWFTTPEGAPYLAWDGGGHGGPYGTIILGSEKAVDVFYWSPRGDRRPTRSTVPGVPSNDEIKKELFTEFRKALFGYDLIMHSAEAYDQAKQFVHNDRGVPTHVVSENTEDAAEKGKQHGDVLTSCVILYHAMRERPQPIPMEPVAPVGSMAWRQERYEEEQRARAKRWYN